MIQYIKIYSRNNKACIVKYGINKSLDGKNIDIHVYMYMFQEFYIYIFMS